MDEKTNMFDDIDQHKENIYVLRHELKSVVPQHKHAQGHILVVMGGAATMNVENTEFYIPNGYFVWLPAGTLHRVSFEGKSINILNIYYPEDFAMSSFFGKVGVYPIPSILFHIVELVSERTCAYRPDDWQYEMMATLNHILPHILHDHRFQLRLPTTDNPVVQRILDIIHQNYQTSLSAQTVAEGAGMSVRSLSRYFRSELGTSFLQYLRTYRIIMAIKMLLEGSESITNIAYSVGYESLTAFSNAFYLVTGTRPSLFLK